MKKDVTINIYRLSVNYNRNIEEGVRAGKYDWANHDITSEHFSTERKGIVEVFVELIHFNRNISTDKALAELDKMGYRPAELQELLALGEKYPDLQREFPIIALGSDWQNPFGGRQCACLVYHGSGRDLHLDRLVRDWERVYSQGWIDKRWDVDCRFAAVRK